MSRAFRWLALSLTAVVGGFAAGEHFADTASPPSPAATPSLTVIAYFRTLDVCHGDPPVSSTIDSVVDLGRHSPEFSFAYRCPDGTRGRAYQDSPNVDTDP